MTKPLVAPCGAILLLTFAIGCGGDDAQPDDGAGADSTSGAEDTTTSAPAAQRHVELTPANPSGGERCSLSQVFFEYDSAELDEASRGAIEAAVDCFRTRGAPARLHLTGATDPRGTEEYNVLLGERRADAVRRYLVGLGVAAERMEVHSMGEETAEGTDEDGWARDRNVTPSSED